MTPRSPFTVALIQDGVEATPAATLVATEARIRAAAARGAQVICLKELFNAPYFCKKLDPSRFDLAEPVAGPTVARLQSDPEHRRQVADRIALVRVQHELGLGCRAGGEVQQQRIGCVRRAVGRERGRLLL